MKKLTESEAWEELAIQWDSPVVIGYVYITSNIYPGIRIFGLYNSINVLMDAQRICRETRSKMLGTLHDSVYGTVHEPQTLNGHYWPFTEDGAKQCADFCRRQAGIH
mgnify:CR=1 FL=1